MPGRGFSALWLALLLTAPACGQTPGTPLAQPAVAAPAEAEPAAAAAEAPAGNLARRTQGEDWADFLGPGRTGRSPETGIRTDWSKGLPLVWTRELGTSYGIGTVSRGRYFQFDRFENRARLYALNAETGEELWRHEYPTHYRDMYGYNGGPRTTPVVDGGHIYALGADGVLLCVEAETGKEVWQVDTNEKFGVVQNFFGVGSTPIVSGDLLLVMVGGSPASSREVPEGALDRVEPNGSGVVAFDKRTGEVKYQLGEELASYASLQTAKIGGRNWCLAFCRGGLLAFEPAAGMETLHYPWRARILESVNASMPVVVDDEIFISETYGPGSALLKLAGGKLETVWADDARSREKAMQTHWNTCIYHEGFLYGSSGRHAHEAEVRCIEWKTGKVRWSEPGLSRCSLTYIDGHLLCLGEYGTLHLLRATPERFEQVAEWTPAENGEQLLNAPAWAAPIVSRGLLYLRGDDRLLCAELIPQR